MVTISQYVRGDGTEPQYARAYRESLLYLMINYIDRFYRQTDSAENDAEHGITYSPLTVAQKRRYRNAIMDNVYKSVNEQNAELKAAQVNGERLDEKEVHTYDTEVLIRAVFSTPPGDRYADRMNDWLNPDQFRGLDVSDVRCRIPVYLNRLMASTMGQTKEIMALNQRPIVIPISPYDPLFAQSDAMTAVDQIGYLTTNIDVVNGKSVPHREDDGKYYKWNPALKIQSGGVISRVFFGSSYSIAGPSLIHKVIDRATADAEARGVDLDDDMVLFGDLYKCGYMSVEPYIRSSSTKKHIRDYLMKEMRDYAEDGIEGSEQAADQYEFINDVCRYLSDHGMKFEVKLDSSNHLVAAIDDGGMMIRLLDRENPSLRGRVFDRGRVYYTTADTKAKDSEERKRITDSCVTNEDCLNTLKWYFGEKVPVAVDSDILKANTGVKALANSVAGELVDWTIGNTTQSTVRAAAGRSGDSRNSVLLSLKSYADDSSKKTTVPVKIMSNPSVVANADSLEILGFGDSLLVTRATFGETRDGFVPEAKSLDYRVNLRMKLPAEKIFPDDLVDSDDIDSAVTIMGEDGVQRDVYPFKTAEQIKQGIAETVSDPTEVDRIFNEKVSYYHHLSARETLDQWVQSAKNRHERELDLDYFANLATEYMGSTDDLDDVRALKASYTAMAEMHFSDREEVANLQRMYWQALIGDRNTLTFDDDDIDEEKGRSAGIAVNGVGAERINSIREHYKLYQDKFFGTVPEIKRDGIVLPDTESHGFNPTNVASYAECEYSGGMQRNIDFIETMLLHLEDDYSDDFIQGDDSYAVKLKNKMLRFDESKIVAGFRFNDIKLLSKPSNIKENYAVNMQVFDDPKNVNLAKLKDKPFTRDMMIHTAQSLVKSGCDPATVALEVDENGVMRYSAVIYTDLSKSKSRMIKGSIGQITEPGEFGEVKPATRVDKGKVYIPGYDAFFVPDDPSHPMTPRERLRCVGYEQNMRNRISECIHNAAFILPSEYNAHSHTTDLNSVYSHMTSMAENAEEFYHRIGKGVDLDSVSKYERDQIEYFRAVIATECGRIRFPNSYADEASSRYALMVNHPELDPDSVQSYTTGDLVGHNIRCLDDLMDCCSLLATGVGASQGQVRFLKEGVVVRPDGTVSAVEGGDCPILNMEAVKHAVKHNPAVRNGMLTNALLSSKLICYDTGIALMDANGYTMDDGIIISKEFSETHQIKGADGKYRPLKVGDKLTDLNGNKGTISVVIDRDAEQTGPDAALIEFLHDNTGVDVISSKYSPLSRYNAGTLIEMNVNKGDVVVTEVDSEGNKTKKTIEGGMGKITMLVMKQSVDSKSTVYDDDLPEGRNASPQLIWTLNALDANAVLQEMFGDNTKGVNKAREYLVALGLDMDGSTNIRAQYTKQPNENRVLMKMQGADGNIPDDDMLFQDIVGKYDMAIADAKASGKSMSGAAMAAAATKKVDTAVKNAIKDITKQVRQDISRQLNKHGGFIELPFPLQYSELNSAIKDADTGGKVDASRETMPTGQTYDIYHINDAGERVVDVSKPTYGVPVLPASMRCGHSVGGGKSSGFDYNSRYARIYEKGEIYRRCELALASVTNDVERAAFESVMSDMKAQAQADLDYIQKDIADRFVNNKHNFVTDGIMTHKQPHSATMVVTADSKLDLDEVGMSRDTARRIGLLKEGQTELGKNNKCLIWRDPCISTGAVRYMRVHLNDELTGIAINPLSDISFDADFDGDTFGVRALMTEEAIAEANKKLTMPQNMLNEKAWELVPDEKNWCPNYHVSDANAASKMARVHPLYIQWGMDVVTAEKLNPEIKARKDDLTLRFNRLNHDVELLKTKAISPENIYVIDKDGNKLTDKDGNAIIGMDAIRIHRENFMRELNELAHDALQHIDTHPMVVKDAQSIAECCDEIIASGAKGSPEAKQKLFDYAGIEVDENGKYDFVTDENGERCSTYHRDGTFVDVVVNDQTLSSLKQDFTGDSGSGTKGAMSAGRLEETEFMRALLNLSSQITQGLMAAKKSAEEGQVKSYVLLMMLKNLYEGNLMTNMDPNTDKSVLLKQPHTVVKTPVTDKSGEPVYDDNGQPKTRKVKCTVKQFCDQWKVFGKLYNVEFSQEYVETIAKHMCDDKGHVVGMTKYAAEHGSLMDQIGYSGGKGLTNIAKAVFLNGCGTGTTLFTGITNVANDYNNTFAEAKELGSKIKAAKAAQDNLQLTDNRAKLSDVKKHRVECIDSMTHVTALAPRAAMATAATYDLLTNASDDIKETNVYKAALAAYKPLGCKDAFLNEHEVAAGMGIMGESQEDYMYRVWFAARGMNGGGGNAGGGTHHMTSLDEEIPDVKGKQLVTAGGIKTPIVDELTENGMSDLKPDISD